MNVINSEYSINVYSINYECSCIKYAVKIIFSGPDGEAMYVVLWLPSRFRQLIFYAICAIFLSLYSLFFSSRACCKFIFHQNTYGICRFRRSYLMI